MERDVEVWWAWRPRQHSWPQAPTSSHSSHARPHLGARPPKPKPKHSRVGHHRRYFACTTHNPTNHTTSIAHHPDDSSAHPRSSALLASSTIRPWILLHSLTAAQKPIRIRTKPQITSQFARPTLTYRLELIQYLDCTSLPTRLRLDPIHPVVHLGLPTPTNHPTT